MACSASPETVTRLHVDKRPWGLEDPANARGLSRQWVVAFGRLRTSTTDFSIGHRSVIAARRQGRSTDSGHMTSAAEQHMISADLAQRLAGFNVPWQVIPPQPGSHVYNQGASG